MTLPARSRRIAVALTQALVAALDVLSQLTPQASRLLIVVLPLTVLMLATAGTLIHDDAERTPPAAPVVVIPPSAWQKSPDHGASAPVAEPYGTIGEKRAVGDDGGHDAVPGRAHGLLPSRQVPRRREADPLDRLVAAHNERGLSNAAAATGRHQQVVGAGCAGGRRRGRGPMTPGDDVAVGERSYAGWHLAVVVTPPPFVSSCRVSPRCRALSKG